MNLEQLAKENPNDQDLGKEVRKFIKSPVIEAKKLGDNINAQALIEFLEYEEALTKDRGTATRIRTLLVKLGIWN
jgi:hypothetical protein